MKLEQMQSSLLSARGSAGLVGGMRAGSSPQVEALKSQLNNLDTQMSLASQKLGTAHPAYIALVEQRKVLVQQLARETASAHAEAAGASSSGDSGAVTARLEAELAAQKQKVLALKPKLDELAQLQREVDLRKSQYERAAVRAADLKLEADVSETGLVPLGDAFVLGTPSFPNKPLILAIGLLAGIAFGVAIAVITELVSRRIRGPEDLAQAANATVLAVIADTAPVSLSRRLRQLLRRDDRFAALPVAS